MCICVCREEVSDSMEYSELPLKLQTCFGVAQMLLTTGTVWMLIRACSLRLHRSTLTITSFFLIAQLLLLQGIGDVYYISGKEREGTLLARAVGNRSAVVICMFLAVLGFCGMVLWIVLYRESREIITVKSIKESIDLLPDGVCFSTHRGMPVLMNREMEKLCADFTGKGLVDTENFWENLKNGRVRENIKVISSKDMLTFQNQDGQVWDFRKSLLSYDSTKIWEITAINVTPQYLLHRELIDRNERLNKVNVRLHNFSQEVERVTREREILSAKVKLHDEIGRSLLILRSYLTQPPEERDRGRLLFLWRYITATMREGKIMQEREDSLQLLKNEAGDFQVDILLEGHLPAEPDVRKILFSAVRECAGNTAKHADGDRLFISITEKQEITEVFIMNNGNPPEGSVRESGGLKNLRILVEKAKGSMEIKSIPSFALRLTFPRQKSRIGQIGNGGGMEL